MSNDIIVTIQPPNEHAMDLAARDLMAKAQSLVIGNQGDYQTAGALRNEAKKKYKELESERKELTRPLDEVKSRLMNKYRPALEFLTYTVEAIDGSMRQYLEDQRRIREEAERKAAEAARKERERLQREALKVEEAARKRREAEEAKIRALEEQGRAEAAEARRRAAEEAEEARMREAQAKREAAEMMPTAPVVHIEPPKAEGISTRKDWDFEILDETLIPREYLSVDEKKIRAVVKALKQHTNIPGVRAFEKHTIASRS